MISKACSDRLATDSPLNPVYQGECLARMELALADLGACVLQMRTWTEASPLYERLMRIEQELFHLQRATLRVGE